MRFVMPVVCAIVLNHAAAGAQEIDLSAAVYADPFAPAAVQVLPTTAQPMPPTFISPDDDADPHAGHDHAPGHPGHDHAAHDHAGHDHASEHNHAGHNHGHGRHSDHEHGFDFIRPYESHDRGTFEAHGHAGHTSIEGYPFVHGIRTEIDFVERALEWDLVRSRGAEGGTIDEWEFDSELVWAFNSRMILIVGGPLGSRDPIIGSPAMGAGDMEVGFQFLAFGGENSLLFTALNIGIPTGDVDRGFGAGNTVLEPTLLWLYDFRQGTYIQSRLGLEMPVSTPDVGSEFRYDIGLFHTFLATKNWRYFRFFTPIVEVNGVTLTNGDGYGETVVDLTAGLRWIVRAADEIGIGYSFPVTGTTNFDEQFIASYRLHF